MGVDISKEVEESRNLSTKFLVSFQAEYQRLYRVGITRQEMRKRDKAVVVASTATAAATAASAGSARSSWVLMRSPIEPLPTHVPKKGNLLIKVSASDKTFTTYFVIVTPDHALECYKNEAAYDSKKDRCLLELNISNRRVFQDANETQKLRQRALAQCFNVSPSDVPKLVPLPPYTMELYHAVRGSMLIQANSEMDLKAWWPYIDECRAAGPKFIHVEDKLHIFVFTKALMTVRREYDVHSLWFSGGGETTQIVDAINEVISHVIQSKIDEQLERKRASFTSRIETRESFAKKVNTFVEQDVQDSWERLYEKTKKVRANLEADFSPIAGKVYEARLVVRQKLADMLTPNAFAYISKELEPSLQVISGEIFPFIRGAFALMIKAFDVALSKAKEFHEQWTRRQDNNSKRLYMVKQYAYTEEFKTTEQRVIMVYFAVAKPHPGLADVDAWKVVDKARRRLRKTYHNALYTFENLLLDGHAVGKSWDAAAAETRSLLVRDCQQAAYRTAVGVLCSVSESSFEQFVVRPARHIAESIQAEIPEEFEPWLDADCLVEETLHQVLKEACCDIVTNSSSGSSVESPKASYMSSSRNVNANFPAAPPPPPPPVNPAFANAYSRPV